MSNDRFIPNSFQVPNALVDDLMAELGGVELKCYLLVIRKTKGWSKDFDAISLSQFVTFTGAGKTAVISALKNLVDAGLLVRKIGARNTSVYAINLFRNSTSSESELVQKVNRTSSESELVTSSESEHTKNNIKNTTQNTNKKNIQKKPAIFGLESHFEKFWSVGMRKVGKSQALKSFKSSYESYNAKYPLSLDDFTQMLVDDVVKRNQLCQFGFDKLHPVTYLNNWRWLDEYPQSNNKTTEKPSAHNNFGERDYGEQVIPEWALEGENDDEKSD
nr:MAG TPA: replication protein O [Bacteriophage sp.]